MQQQQQHNPPMMNNSNKGLSYSISIFIVYCVICLGRSKNGSCLAAAPNFSLALQAAEKLKHIS
jgi:hypothetical protein